MSLAPPSTRSDEAAELERGLGVRRESMESTSSFSSLVGEAR